MPEVVDHDFGHRRIVVHDEKPARSYPKCRNYRSSHQPVRSRNEFLIP